MRKIYALLLILALLFAALPASADSYQFGKLFMLVDIPLDEYMVQITPQTVNQYSEFLATIGHTPESMLQYFNDEGVLVWAFDEAHGRTLVITAVQDAPAKEYYDINEQTPATRATYRASHTNGTFYSKTDYSFESCEWKNFGDAQGRFLMIRYAHKIDGKVAWRGEWRRTIRNGYTLTIDMRVVGRSVSSGDIGALNRIQNSISFVTMTEAPEALLTLAFSAPPPESTNSDTFTVKGTTRPGASVVAAYAALQSSKSKVFSTTADAKGAFLIDVTLPGKDLYNVIVSASYGEGTDNAQDVSETFSVEYDPTALPVSFTSPFPEVFTTDSFKLSGTTMTGVTIQMVVNNELQTKKTGNNRTFSFTVDTSKEGDYAIQLTFTKKDYDTKVFSYVIHRQMDDGQRRQTVRDTSISPDYANISRSPERYEGRVLRYKGYVTDVKQNGGEWVVTFATDKSGANYKNLLIALSDSPVSADPETLVTLYGTMNGTYTLLTEQGQEVTYPRVNLAFID
ncbi:MAG: hypothetical protein IJ664_04750 [Clostridia bacterium]|nr:hypothetical protein [Clostridia bacterium]